MLRQTAMQWPESKGRRPERDVPRSAFWHVAYCTSRSLLAARSDQWPVTDPLWDGDDEPPVAR